jgi:hypothetical protein
MSVRHRFDRRRRPRVAGDSQRGGADKRASQRIHVRFPVTFTSHSTEGTAYAQNISVTGALLEEADPPLLAGGKIRLRFSLFPDSLPIEIEAEVVRETEAGFAVRFSDLEVRSREVLRRAIVKALNAAADRLVPFVDDEEEDRTLLNLPKP